MAEIKFASENTLLRYQKCKTFTESKGDKSLENCLDNLRRWRHPIMVGSDYDEMSFTFREILPNELTQKGYHGINGGIIYHGPRDGFGCGAAPTFSVTITETEGYSIHT